MSHSQNNANTSPVRLPPLHPTSSTPPSPPPPSSHSQSLSSYSTSGDNNNDNYVINNELPPPEYTPQAENSSPTTIASPDSYPIEKKSDLEPEITSPTIDRADDSLTREPVAGVLDHDPSIAGYGYPLPNYEEIDDSTNVAGVPQAVYDETGGRNLGQVNISLEDGVGERAGKESERIGQTGAWDTRARVQDDGRVDITLCHTAPFSLPTSIKRVASMSSISSLLLQKTQLPSASSQTEQVPQITTPATAAHISPLKGLNIVMQVIGSRGDIQPFLSLALVLAAPPYSNRIRIATHECFRAFVGDAGKTVEPVPESKIEGCIEFFPIGGDPHELMSYMVKNPGLMPSMETVRSGEIRKRRKVIWEILLGAWASCFDRKVGGEMELGGAVRQQEKPFVADVIIANPPGFAHIHCAERLGLPLHLMFTMPWTATQAFPHPLANIQIPKQSSSSSSSSSMLSALHLETINFLSYSLVEMITWQGLGDLINRFRETVLGLEPLSSISAPGLISRLKIPYTYCWSPSLIPKPADWGNHCSVVGFWFLDLAKGSHYEPPRELIKFLGIDSVERKRENETPIVYVGFGSIVVDDPKHLTELVVRAVKMAGVKAVISKGWGTIAPTPERENDEDILYIDNCPHDWLFEQVDSVVHHGGAGTTAAGIRAGKPNVVIPFFGDQWFWGNMVHRAGSGPAPVPYKKRSEDEESLSSEVLASMILEALSPSCRAKAAEIGEIVRRENGQRIAAEGFMRTLQQGGDMTCAVASAMTKLNRNNSNDNVAGSLWGGSVGSLSVKFSKRISIRMCPVVAVTLIEAGLLEEEKLRVSRFVEYETAMEPIEPFTGAAGALLGTIGSLLGHGLDLPRDLWREVRRKKGKELVNITAVKGSQSVNNLVSGESVTTEGNISAEDVNITIPSTSQVVIDSSTNASAKADFTDLQPHPSVSPGLSPSYGQTSQPQTPTSPSHITISKPVTLSASALGKIVETSLKSPLDFTKGLHQGLHNASKLYGDSTVRKQESITGFNSGLRAAGKEFGLGFYDGVTGVVTQPIKGAKEEGVIGAIKGFGKGIGGLVLKPGAGIFGLPGYAMEGVYVEIKKRLGGTGQVGEVEETLRAMRLLSGRKGWVVLRQSEKGEIVKVWKALWKELEEAEVCAKKGLLIQGLLRRKQREGVKNGSEGGEGEGTNTTKSSILATSTATMSSIFAPFAAKKAQWEQKQKEQKQVRKDGGKEDNRMYEETFVDPADYQYPLNVLPMIQEMGFHNTSSYVGSLGQVNKLAQEDGSIREGEELRKVLSTSSAEYQEREMMEKAIKESIEEYKVQRRRELEVELGVQVDKEANELEQAIRESLQTSGGANTEGRAAAENEEFKRAVEESRRMAGLGSGDADRNRKGKEKEKDVREKQEYWPYKPPWQDNQQREHQYQPYRWPKLNLSPPPLSPYNTLQPPLQSPRAKLRTKQLSVLNIPENFSLQESKIEVPPHSPLSPYLVEDKTGVSPTPPSPSLLLPLPSKGTMREDEEDEEDDDLKRAIELSKIDEEDRKRREGEEEKRLIRLIEALSSEEVEKHTGKGVEGR